MESIKRIDLSERARARAAAIFRAWDLTRIAAPLGGLEDLLNSTHRHRGEQFFAVTDRMADIHEDQHTRETAQQLLEIDQDEQIARIKFDTGVQKNAIRLTAEEYVLQGKSYDAHVKEIVMTAREYAAEIERELALLEKKRAEMDVRKQQMELMRVTTEIRIEAVNRAMVEAEILRAQLAAKKAQVQVLMANYEAGEAEIKVLQVELEAIQANVEKMTLKADIAMIFADIVTRKLAETKFDVENKALLQKFQFVAWKLGSMLARWDTMMTISGVKQTAEETILAIFAELIEADRQEHLLQLFQLQKSTELWQYELTRTMGGSALGEVSWSEAQINLMQMKYTTWKALLEADTWQKKLVNAARRWAFMNQLASDMRYTSETQLISKG